MGNQQMFDIIENVLKHNIDIDDEKCDLIIHTREIIDGVENALIPYFRTLNKVTAIGVSVYTNNALYTYEMKSDLEELLDITVEEPFTFHVRTPYDYVKEDVKLVYAADYSPTGRYLDDVTATRIAEDIRNEYMGNSFYIINDRFKQEGYIPRGVK